MPQAMSQQQGGGGNPLAGIMNNMGGGKRPTQDELATSYPQSAYGGGKPNALMSMMSGGAGGPLASMDPAMKEALMSAIGQQFPMFGMMMKMMQNPEFQGQLQQWREKAGQGGGGMFQNAAGKIAGMFNQGGGQRSFSPTVSDTMPGQSNQSIEPSPINIMPVSGNPAGITGTAATPTNMNPAARKSFDYSQLAGGNQRGRFPWMI